MLRRYWLVVAVIIALLFGIFIVWMNVPVNSGEIDKNRHKPAEYEGETIELSYVLASNELRIQQRDRQKVDHYKGKTIRQHLALRGCVSILTTDRAINMHGEYLYSVAVKATACRNNGKWTVKDFDRRYNIGNQWWNLYRFQKWNKPVRTIRNRYLYNRQQGFFEACVSWCFYDNDAWVAQTIRKNLTYSTDWKRRD